MKVSNPEYLAKVKELTEEEQERLLSRMTGKLPRRLEKDQLSRDEAIAIQMELEDEQLQEWREKMHALKAKEKEAGKKKDEKAKEKEVGKKKDEKAKPEVVGEAKPKKPR